MCLPNLMPPFTRSAFDGRTLRFAPTVYRLLTLDYRLSTIFCRLSTNNSLITDYSSTVTVFSGQIIKKVFYFGI